MAIEGWIESDRKARVAEEGRTDVERQNQLNLKAKEEAEKKNKALKKEMQMRLEASECSGSLDSVAVSETRLQYLELNMVKCHLSKKIMRHPVVVNE